MGKKRRRMFNPKFATHSRSRLNAEKTTNVEVETLEEAMKQTTLEAPKEQISDNESAAPKLKNKTTEELNKADIGKKTPEVKKPAIAATKKPKTPEVKTKKPSAPRKFKKTSKSK